MDATNGSAAVFGRTVAIIGAGRLGQAIGTLLRQAGVDVKAVSSHSLETAQAAVLASGGRATVDHAEAARVGQFVLVALPDDSVAEVVSRVASEGGFSDGQVVAHSSPSLGLDVLEPAATVGAAVGCLSPVQRFLTAEHAVKGMQGAVFSVTADETACPVIESFVHLLGGVPVRVANSVRPLVDAAISTASQGALMTWDAAAEMLVEAGFTTQQAKAALVPLARGMENILRQFGTRGALSGPAARGDAATVAAHVAALDRVDPETAALYRLLALRAVEASRAAEQIDQDTASAIQKVLAEPDMR